MEISTGILALRCAHWLPHRLSSLLVTELWCVPDTDVLLWWRMTKVWQQNLHNILLGQDAPSRGHTALSVRISGTQAEKPEHLNNHTSSRGSMAALHRAPAWSSWHLCNGYIYCSMLTNLSTSFIIELVLTERSQIPFYKYGTTSVTQKYIPHHVSSTPFFILKENKAIFSFSLKRKDVISTITVLIPESHIIYSKGR